MANATKADIAALQAQISTLKQQVNRMDATIKTLQGQLARVKKG